jgi:hypothetical protein
MKTIETIKAIETLKKLATDYTLIMEFAESLTRDSGEPVIRIKIDELDIEVEDTILAVIEKADEEVKEYFKQC